MKNRHPPPPIPLQSVVNHERAQRLLEIEEEENAVLDRLRKVVDKLKTKEEARRFGLVCVQKCDGGELSVRTLKRVRMLMSRKIESWKVN